MDFSFDLTFLSQAWEQFLAFLNDQSPGIDLFCLVPRRFPGESDTADSRRYPDRIRRVSGRYGHCPAGAGVSGDVVGQHIGVPAGIRGGVLEGARVFSGLQVPDSHGKEPGPGGGGIFAVRRSDCDLQPVSADCTGIYRNRRRHQPDTSGSDAPYTSSSVRCSGTACLCISD